MSTPATLMRTAARSLPRRLLCLIAVALLAMPPATSARRETVWEPIRVLIVGGGPSLEYNQVAIESNVRYVGKLLPPGTARTTLFADGNLQSATVLYDTDSKSLPVAERVLNLLLNGEDSADDPSHYRKPSLGGKLDGPSKRSEINRAFTQLAQEDESRNGRQLFLYFTGHGSQNKNDLENNHYDLWGDKEELSVRDLARHIAHLPRKVPVAVVMVQCFSGAFGNLIFEDGDPKGAMADRDIVGFFATVKERVAAGCTSAVNEAEYRDFTSYFFAALTGRDRVGRPITGADYNGDGRVGMDEAYCYTLSHDDSIDVPVCTSDVFLRRYMASSKDPEVMQTTYSKIREWASPAQLAALDALSDRLHLSSESRLATAYRKMLEGDSHNYLPEARQARRNFTSLQQQGRRRLFQRWPGLANAESAAFKRDRREAIAWLGPQAEDGKWKDLLDAYEALAKVELQQEGQEIAESRLIRFVRLGKSVVLAHRLRETGEPEVKARFARLIEAEGRTLLPPADAFERASNP